MTSHLRRRLGVEHNTLEERHVLPLLIILALFFFALWRASRRRK
jgi:preprotein translocase subunit YajC